MFPDSLREQQRGSPLTHGSHQGAQVGRVMAQICSQTQCSICSQGVIIKGRDTEFRGRHRDPNRQGKTGEPKCQAKHTGNDGESKSINMYICRTSWSQRP